MSIQKVINVNIYFLFFIYSYYLIINSYKIILDQMAFVFLFFTLLIEYEHYSI